MSELAGHAAASESIEFDCHLFSEFLAVARRVRSDGKEKRLSRGLGFTNSRRLACKHLDHRRAIAQAAHRVDAPCLCLLTRNDVLAQWRKSLGLQFPQHWSKVGSNFCTSIAEGGNLKPCREQIGSNLIQGDEKTGRIRRSSWQRIIGFPGWTRADER